MEGRPNKLGCGRRSPVPAGDTQMPPIALTIAEACAASRIGRTRLYEAIRAGEVCARKHGKRTLILDEDFRSWLESLPAVQPKKKVK